MKYIISYGQPKDIKIDNIRKKGYIKDILDKDLLPHVGKDRINKLFYLGYIITIQEFKTVFPQDTRGHYLYLKKFHTIHS